MEPNLFNSRVLDEMSDTLRNKYEFFKNITCEQAYRPTAFKKLKKIDRDKLKHTPIHHFLSATILPIQDIIAYFDTQIDAPATFTEFKSILIHLDTLKSSTKLLHDMFVEGGQPDSSHSFKHKGEAIAIKGIPSSYGLISDAEYFDYIRAVCVSNPLDSSKHPLFQGSELEWCIFADSNKNIHRFSHPNASHIAQICTSRYDAPNKLIPLYYTEFIDYACHLLKTLDNIKVEFDRFVASIKPSLDNLTIQLESEFISYPQYLLNLLAESTIRDCPSYEIEPAIALFSIQMSGAKNTELLNEYKAIVKTNIETLHQQLQSMTCDDSYTIFPSTEQKIIHNYAMEKLSYLCLLCERMQLEISLENIQANAKVNAIEHMDGMKNYLSKPFSQEHMDHINEFCTDPEWSRILLHQYTDKLSDYIDLDLLASDWSVYWQVQLALFAMTKEKNSGDTVLQV